MSEPTNADLYGVLLDIKEDIGGLKTGQNLQLEALRNHSTRIGVLEDGASRQRGAVRVWGLVATAASTALGGLVSWVFHRGH